jgi:hypothetical protein
MLYNKEQIREAALEGVILVEFTKKDGTLREMRCSLNEKYLPPAKIETASRPWWDSPTPPATAENLDVLAVWDIEAKGWRSFRIDSVISMEKDND